MQANLPTLEKTLIQISYGGIELIANEDIEDEQLGYSVGPDGSSLTGESDGDWKKAWVVIGRETLCGDPIFIDTSSPDFPVFTAGHG